MRVPQVVGALLFPVVLACAGAGIPESPPVSPLPATAPAPVQRLEALQAAAAGGAREDAPSSLDRAESGGAEGRYQAVRLESGSGWVILDTETGVFEHWVPVAGTSRYHVFRCQFGGGCPLSDKRSVDRGLDP